MTPDQHRQTATELARDTIRGTTPTYVAGYLAATGHDPDEPGVLTTDTDTITNLLHTATVTLTWPASPRPIPTRADFIRDFDQALAEPAPTTERIPTQAELLDAATPPKHRPVPTMAERITAARQDGRHLTAETARQALDAMYTVRDQLAAELERVTAERDHARTGWQATADALARAHTGWGGALQQAYAAQAPGSPERAQELPTVGPRPDNARCPSRAATTADTVIHCTWSPGHPGQHAAGHARWDDTDNRVIGGQAEQAQDDAEQEPTDTGAFNAGVAAAADAIEQHAEAIGWYEGGGVWADAIEQARKATR